SAIVDSWRAPRQGGGEGHTTIESVEVRGGSIYARQDGVGEIHAENLSLQATRDQRAKIEVHEFAAELKGDVRLAAKRVSIDERLAHLRPDGLPRMEIEGGSATPFTGLWLSGIHGTLAPDEKEPTKSLLDLSGSYGGSDKTLWTCVGWFDLPTRQGGL